jgi:DNA-binding transcriptional regulator YiaG
MKLRRRIFNWQNSKSSERKTPMGIKNLRTLSGMTQQSFADYFGISKRAVESWEGGQRKCPDYLLDLMAYKLKNEGIIKAGD